MEDLMKFLLINTNQIVQKLVEITAKKAGANLVSIKESSELGDLSEYDYVIIDDDSLMLDKQTYLDALASKRKCLIYNKQTERFDGFDAYVQKPFLPTSILDVFVGEIERTPKQGHESVDNGSDLVDIALDIEGNDEISLDNLDEGLEGVDSLLGEDLDGGLENLQSVDEDAGAMNDEELLNTLDGDENDKDKSEGIDSNGAESSEESDDGGAIDLNTDTQTDEQNSLDSVDSKEVDESLGAENGDGAEIQPTYIEEDDMSGLEIDDQSPKDEKIDDGLDVDIDLSALDSLDDFAHEEESKGLESEDLDLSTLEAGDDDLEALLSGEATEGVDDTAENIEEMDSNLDEEILKDEIQQEGDKNQANEEENPLDTSLSEDDLLSDVEGIDLEDGAESMSDLSAQGVLDKEEIDEVTKALSALDEGDKKSEESVEEGEDKTEEMEALESGEQDIENFSLDEDMLASDDLDGVDFDLENSSSNGDTKLELEDFGEDFEGGGEENAEKEDEEYIEDMIETHAAQDDSSNDENKMEESSLVPKEDSQLDIENTVDDFTTLKEVEVAHALGEEIDGLEENELEENEEDEQVAHELEQSQIIMPSESNAQNVASAISAPESEMIKSMITNSVQGSIASLGSGNLKSMLDGLEVTINISFKDKSK